MRSAPSPHSRPGGRWWEHGTDGTGREWGRMLVWEPPDRVVLAWQINARFRHDPVLVTGAEIRFTTLATGSTRHPTDADSRQSLHLSAGTVCDHPAVALLQTSSGLHP